MRHPQAIVFEADGWLARQLGELAAESRWLVRGTRSADTARSLVRAAGVGVLLVQFEPGAEKAAAPELIAEVRRVSPDVPVVAVADAKLPDAERAAWTAALLDLGARYVLFPPLTKPVLEDVVSGLMTAAVRRVLGAEPDLPPLPKRTSADEVIDLADEDSP